MNNISILAPRPTRQARPLVQTATAVARFLKDMMAAAKAGFPLWEERLQAGLEECHLPYETRRSVLDIHPLDDYYLAGVIALEAAKVRHFFAPARAAEILSLIAEQVDGLAQRHDRVVSDLVFFLIGRIDLVAAGGMKLPHDQVVRGLLERLGVDKIEATAHLLRDVYFRHTLGEPLARGVPQWWATFERKYVMVDALPPAAGLKSSSAKQLA
jgi:hypothetical protein